MTTVDPRLLAEYWQNLARAHMDKTDRLEADLDQACADLAAAQTREAKVRALHRPVRHDWRGGYCEVCRECAVERTEPYYNESRSWWELADWPCPTVRALDGTDGGA